MTINMPHRSARVEGAAYTEKADTAALADMAFNLTRVGGNIVDASQQAAQALLATRVPVDGETADVTSGADLGKPALAAPRASLVQLKGHSSAGLMQLLGELSAILGEAGQTELEGRLALFKDMAEARKKSLENVSQEFSAATDESEQGVAQFERARQQTGAARQSLDRARQEATAAETGLTALENDDPARPQAMQRNEAAQKCLLAATRTHNGAVEHEKRLSAEILQKVRIATDLETRSKAEIAAQSRHRGPDELKDSTARLSMLMGALNHLLGEAGEASMKADQELFREMQTKRQQALEKSADDHDADVRKAEQVSKTMGCIGKVIGYLVTAISIVALPFTGGASLALAVIGLGLTAADAITKASTGSSLVDRAMQPIMTHVIQPMIEAVGKMITGILVKAGVPKEKAELIGAIVAAVAVAIMMIVLMIVVSVAAKGPAAAKMAQKLLKPMGKMIGKMTTRMTETAAGRSARDLLKPMTEAIAKKTSKMALNPATIKRAGEIAETGGTVLGGAGSAATGSGDVAAGAFMKRASEHEADILLSGFELKQIERYLSTAAQRLSGIVKEQQRLTVTATNAMQTQSAAARHVLSRTRA